METLIIEKEKSLVIYFKGCKFVLLTKIDPICNNIFSNVSFIIGRESKRTRDQLSTDKDRDRSYSRRGDNRSPSTKKGSGGGKQSQ